MNRTFKLILAFAAGSMLAASANMGWAKTQTFDSEASAAAGGWTGTDNRVPAYGTDFGWSNSNLAAGASGAGEAGGYFPRHTLPVGSYADVSIGTATLNQPLSASGKIVFFTENLDGGVRLGWFNKDSTNSGESLPPSVAISFAEGARFQPSVRLENSNGVSGPLTQPNIGSNVTSFALNWNPATRILSTTFGGVTVDAPALSEAQFTLGSTMNAFGLFTGASGSDNINSRARVFIDDVDYSVGVPEPATLALLAIAASMGLCARRRTES